MIQTDESALRERYLIPASHRFWGIHNGVAVFSHCDEDINIDTGTGRAWHTWMALGGSGHYFAERPWRKRSCRSVSDAARLYRDGFRLWQALGHAAPDTRDVVSIGFCHAEWLNRAGQPGCRNWRDGWRKLTALLQGGNNL